MARKKTDAELRLSGSRRAGKRGEVDTGEGVGECPEWLDADSRGVWARLIPSLESAGVLQRADSNILARYCRTWTEWKRASVFIDANGMTYEVMKIGRANEVKAYPQVAILNSLSSQLLQLERQLGMTPGSRAKLPTVKPKSARSPLEIKYFAGLPRGED